MLKHLKKQYDDIKHYYKKSGNKNIIIAFIIFLFINTAKIAIFNILLTDNHSLRAFTYKFIYTFIFVFITWILIFRYKSSGLAITFYTLQLLYCCINFMYFIFFNRYLHILQWFTLFDEAFTVTKNFQIPLDAKLLIELIDLPVFLYIIKHYKKTNKTRKDLKYLARSGVALFVAVLFLIESYNLIRKHSLLDYINNIFLGESLIVERYGTLVNNLTDLKTLGNESKMIQMLNAGKQQKNNIDKSEIDNTFQKPNIFIIQVESMDSSIINQKNNGKYVTPYLHSLSESNIYYPYMLSYHLGGGTSDCDFSINNSVEPLTFFPAIKLVGYQYKNALPNQLNKGGYYSAAFHGNYSTYFSRDTAFVKMGYNDFFDLKKSKLKTSGWGASDRDVMNFAIEKAKTFQEPFYSYLITMTSHTAFTNVNYCAPENNEYNNVQTDIVRQYFKSLNYVDTCIKEYISSIKQSFPNSYVLIFGDHTPAIKDPPYKQASLDEDSQYYEFVPLIILTPDNIKYKETTYCASFLDIEPTILNASGIKFDIQSDGANLLDFKGERPDIPFKGTLQKRDILFRKVEQAVK